MKHIKGMAAITNPLVNSYKRLVPGFEAPVYIAWSTTNRSPLIRIPATADGEGTRIELRSPDSAANPYLTLAVCLSAGLQGIREKILPPESINANIFALTAKERKELNIDQLPGTLLEAVEELEKDTFIQDVLGDHIAGKYIDAKRKEWHEYRSQVSELLSCCRSWKKPRESKVSWSAAASRSRVSVLRVPRRSARRTD